MATNSPLLQFVKKTGNSMNEEDTSCIDYSVGNSAEHLDENSLKEVHELITNAKFGRFAKVWAVLEKTPHFINCIPEVRPFGILHQAAFLRNKSAVIKALSYPQCNPFIQTNQDADNKFGKGRTADELNVNEEIQNIILEAQQKYKLRIGTSKHLRENGDYLTRDRDAIDSIAKFIETDDWENIHGVLKCSPHLINVVIPSTELTILHQVVIDNSLDLVTQMLDYPASNPYVETGESELHRYDAGKTPGELTEDVKIIDVINEKKDEMTRNYLSLPNIVLPWQASASLIAFFSSVLEDYQSILCPNGMLATNQDLRSLSKHVFLHMNRGSNWVLAKREVAYQIRNFDIQFSNLLESIAETQKTTEANALDGKRVFYSKLIQIYIGESKKLIYHHFNRLFYEQFLLGKDKTCNTNLELGLYALVLNALLLHWDGLETYHGYTYREVYLEQSLQDKLVDGYEFSLINFLSCSVSEDTNYQTANCMLKIDNSTICPWSPKLIGKFAATPEQEYLYPCGARFKVTYSVRNCISLKLIDPQ